MQHCTCVRQHRAGRLCTFLCLSSARACSCMRRVAGHACVYACAACTRFTTKAHPGMVNQLRWHQLHRHRSEPDVCPRHCIPRRSFQDKDALFRRNPLKWHTTFHFLTPTFWYLVLSAPRCGEYVDQVPYHPYSVPQTLGETPMGNWGCAVALYSSRSPFSCWRAVREKYLLTPFFLTEDIYQRQPCFPTGRVHCGLKDQ